MFDAMFDALGEFRGPILRGRIRSKERIFRRFADTPSPDFCTAHFNSLLQPGAGQFDKRATEP
jgi:hypothetical protein